MTHDEFRPDHNYDRLKLWNWICAYQATAKGAHDRSKTKTALVKRFDCTLKFEASPSSKSMLYHI